VERLLSACADTSVNVVFTAHDATPMFGTADGFQSRLELLARSQVTWIGLTTASVDALRDRVPRLPPVTVIPHGYVVNPDNLTGATRNSSAPGPRYLLYGALRPNRDHLATITNWSLRITDPAARLTLLLRGLSPADFNRYDIPALLAITRSDPRIQTSMRAYHSDHEVATAGLHADALLMPYLFGSHSGQLELAFDLNLVPVCSTIGFLKDQYRIHDGLVDEPIWFDWAEGHPCLFGENFVAALETAHTRLTQTPRRNPNADFLEYRRDEHRRFLDAHRAIYQPGSVIPEGVGPCQPLGQASCDRFVGVSRLDADKHR
jgi:hypothetical protein